MQALGTAYQATGEVGSQVQAFEARDVLRREADQLSTAQVNDDAPVVQVVQMIITQGLRDRASDIHIEPPEDRVRVRYRIDGALHDVLDLPGSIGPALVSRIKILAGMNIVERRRPQDGQIAMEVEGREVDIRVATHRGRRGREGRACGCWTRAARCSSSSSSACRPTPPTATAR